MATNIPGYSLVATKQADTTVQLVFYSTFDGLNPNGNIRFAIVISAANFTALNTTVNGGSSGANLTQTIPENTNTVDYPTGYCAPA